MTERDIRDMAKQAGFKGRICFYSSKNHHYSDYGAVAFSRSRTISFNRKQVCGHIAARHARVASFREVEAHNWAIVKAMQLHWTAIAQYLIKAIEGWQNDEDPLYIRGYEIWSKVMERERK